MIQINEYEIKKFGTGKINYEILKILCELAIIYPDISLDQISQEVYNEIETTVLEFINSFRFPKIKSKIQKKKDLLKYHRMPKRSKEKLKKDTEYESKIKIFRNIQNHLKKLKDTSINFDLERPFERNKVEFTDDLPWRKNNINEKDISNDVVDLFYKISPQDQIRLSNFSNSSFYMNQTSLNTNKIFQINPSMPSSNKIEKMSQVEIIRFEDKLSDFEYGMFPKGDPAFDKFIPGKFNLKIPRFTFKKEKEKEIGIFMEPIIDEDTGE